MEILPNKNAVLRLQVTRAQTQVTRAKAQVTQASS